MKKPQKMKNRRNYLDWRRDVPFKYVLTASFKNGNIAMTQVDMAEALGITRVTLATWLKDPLYKKIEEVYTSLDYSMGIGEFTDYVMNIIEAEEEQEESGLYDTEPNYNGGLQTA